MIASTFLIIKIVFKTFLNYIMSEPFELWIKYFIFAQLCYHWSNIIYIHLMFFCPKISSKSFVSERLE